MLVVALRIVLERLVVRNVVAAGFDGVVTSKACCMCAADRTTHGIVARWAESAREPAPRYSLRVEQVADVCASDADQSLCEELGSSGIGGDAIVECRARIADYRAGSLGASDISAEG